MAETTKSGKTPKKPGRKPKGKKRGGKTGTPGRPPLATNIQVGLLYITRQHNKILCLLYTIYRPHAHWVESDIRKIKTMWKHECLRNGRYTNSRGVTILLRNSFEYEIQNIYKMKLVT